MVSKTESNATDPKGLKVILFKDGIRYSINMANLAFSRLKLDLMALTKNTYSNRKCNEDELTKEQIFTCQLSALSHAWQIVDSVNRLKDLLMQCPNLKHKDPEYALFKRNTEDIEQLRNNIQHLNKEIENYIKQQIPAWGTLNWVSKIYGEFLIFSFIPGEIFARNTHLINPLGRKITMPIGAITLVSDKEVCISELIEIELDRIKGWLEKTQGIDFSPSGQSMILSIEFVPGQPNQ